MMKEFGEGGERARKRKCCERTERKRRKKGEQFTTEITEWCNEEQRQRTKGTHQGEIKVVHGQDRRHRRRALKQ